MKKLFAKDNFIVNTFDKKQKRQSLIISILLILFFAVSSFTFFNMLYALSDATGSLVSGSPDVMLTDLLRTLPLYFSFFMSLWTVLLLQALFRNVNDVKRHKSLFKDAICLISFGGVNILYVIIMRIAGRYLSLVEGSPSPFYPLDSMLFSLLFIAIGVFVILYVKNVKGLKDKIQFVLPTRGNIVTKARGLYLTFLTFFILIALFGFSGSIYSIFIYDFIHGYAFYGVMTIFAYAMSPIILGFWEFYYNELKEEKKKELLLPISLISLGVSIVVMVLYFVALGTDMDAPSNAGFGMFPVTFAASVNLATMLVVASPTIFSIVALIKGLILRKKK